MGEIAHINLPQEHVVWSVRNLLPASSSNGSSMISPLFSLLDDKWQLALIPCVGERGLVETLGLFLWKLNPPNHQYHVNLDLKSILNVSYHSVPTEKSISGKLDSNGHFGTWTFLDIRPGSHWAPLSSPRGYLIISCKILKEEKIDRILQPSEEREKVIEKDNVKKNVPEAKGVDRLHQNFEKMFLEGLNSDFLLKVENSEFPVHRCVLSARSTVFESMFHHDMSEKSGNAVDIPDCSAESFKVFLRYLYTGRVDTMSSKNVFNLYYAADKYAVSDLKEDCVAFMKDNLSVDTFCDVIALSLRHCESELQKAATQFFRANIREIIKTVQWQKYLSENSTHANELFITALNA